MHTVPLSAARHDTDLAPLLRGRLERHQSGATTTLPDDLVREQSVRIQIFYAVGVALWLLNLLLDLKMSLHGDRGPYRSLIEGLGAVLAEAAGCYMRVGRAPHRLKVDIGVALIVPSAFAIALLNNWTAQPTTSRPLSGIAPLILLFAMLAPTRPRKMLAATLAAASMDPLAVWIAHLRGMPVPSPLTTLLMYLPNYICALLSVAPARILYRLGRQIREAQALGSYELVERLGEGGMGEVWRGRHRLLARSAAIKLIRPEMIDGTRPEESALTLTRFEREAQATAALTSPHTVRLFDFGLTPDGTFYYVMELLSGRDLQSLVQQFGPLPPARAMHVLDQVCRSLAEAHARGLIHRDIKPANIYACRLGLEYDFVKVLDFGLVKHEDHSTAPTLLTAGPMTVGTPAYMAPEAILGDAVLDRRVDIYAAGCVAYYLLTGQRVFEADSTMKLLMQHVQASPVAPSRRAASHVPREIDDLVLACLHKDPDRRPQDAGELQQMIRACVTIEPWTQDAARAWWDRHLPSLTTLTTDLDRLPTSGSHPRPAPHTLH